MLKIRRKGENMKKTTNKLLIALAIFIGILLISSFSQAASLNLKNLQYDVQLNEDGSADVVETWKIYIEDTNTLFKTFEIDKTKYKEITDVKVSEIKSNGTQKDFEQTYEYQYHVDKDCYYGLVNDDGMFEIAWGAHAEDTTRTYKIGYKIVDAVKKYNDCAEFYWQFVSTESEIPADTVKGTIKLPNSVTNIEDLRVWAHGPLNGNINRVSENTVQFEVEDFDSNTMLEARVVTPTNIFTTLNTTLFENKLNSILEQEQQWADEANAERERIAKRQEMINKALKIGFIITNVIGLVVTIAVSKKIIKYRKELAETPKAEPEEKFEFYRDIPDENASPAQAGYLYYFKNGSLELNISKAISATMLDLCMKDYLEFETLPDKKDQIKINLKIKDINNLPSDERLVYGMLKNAANQETNSLTMKDFEKYASKHASTFSKNFTKIAKEAEKIEESYGNVDKKLISKSENWAGAGVGYIFLAILSIFIMQLVVIPSIIAAVYSFTLSSRYNRLTQKGINEKEKWDGLKRYMEEFSMIDDKTVPELVLWEKYLVYATVFGIADKVLKQLKVVYPQITNSDYMTSHGYTYMHLMYASNFNNSFIKTLDNSVKTTYSNTNLSSGSGSGGGFSGGGGFGGGGGRNGRKIKYKFRINLFKIAYSVITILEGFYYAKI